MWLLRCLNHLYGLIFYIQFPILLSILSVARALMQTTRCSNRTIYLDEQYVQFLNEYFTGYCLFEYVMAFWFCQYMVGFEYREVLFLEHFREVQLEFQFPAISNTNNARRSCPWYIMQNSPGGFGCPCFAAFSPAGEFLNKDNLRTQSCNKYTSKQKYIQISVQQTCLHYTRNA